MSKRTIVVLAAAVGFLALLLVPAVVFTTARTNVNAAPAQNTASFAFTGLTTKGEHKGATLTGGLTLAIQKDGSFKGTFHLPGDTRVPVSGQIEAENKIDIKFLSPSGHPFIRGEGQLNSKKSEFIGTFRVFRGDAEKEDQVASGIWSALFVAKPADTEPFAFVGVTKSGPDEDTAYRGAIVLDDGTPTLTGTFNEPDGTIVPVKATIAGKNITIIFHIGDGKTLTAQGDLESVHPKYYKGTFAGPGHNDRGTWDASLFGFGFPG